MRILIKNGKVVDPSQDIEEIMDVLIEGNKIKGLGKNISQKNCNKVIQAKNKIVIPGIVDIHVHLREPGNEDEETISTGTKAALSGGVTSVCCMPNTNPPIDNQTSVEFILMKAKSEGVVNVYPIGTISKNRKSEELSEIGELKLTGVVGISDDGNTVMNSLIMRRALEYSKMFDLPVISHCEDENLSRGGVMNEGYVSTLLGLRGIPREAEETMVIRDIILARLTGGRLHIAHVSTKGSVELIRKAKEEGINVTAEVTPHHLVLTEEAVKTFDTNTKVKPPLRTEEDIEALKEGLKDGTIDCIVSDHAPHTEEEKNKEYEIAPFGIIGLETLLPLTITFLVRKNILALKEAVRKLTYNPAKIVNINRGSLKRGSPADLVIFDLNKKRKINSFVSKSKNSPFIGWELFPTIDFVICNGKVFSPRGKTKRQYPV